MAQKLVKQSDLSAKLALRAAGKDTGDITHVSSASMNCVQASCGGSDAWKTLKAALKGQNQNKLKLCCGCTGCIDDQQQ